MAYVYTPPEFLQGQSANEIHQRMLDALPAFIDKAENTIPWDYTRPPALEKAQFVQFILNEAVKAIFPQWASGTALDFHAESTGLTRLPANKAAGMLDVWATPDTVIPVGTVFATPASGDSSSILFESTEDVTVDYTGRALVPVQALVGGTEGNVPPDTIILMSTPIRGVSRVTNPLPTTGGAAGETDDALRDRILSEIRAGMSYTGCDADYVRWAKEVPGVGEAVCDAEWNGPGTVRLLIVDPNGAPANEAILEAVYNHIIHPEDRMLRLAPIGATLTVAAPEPLYIDVTATVQINEEYTLTQILNGFKENLGAYLLTAVSESDIYDIESGAAENSVKYVFVGSALAQTQGVINYSQLTLNGSTLDVPIPLGLYPEIRDVTLNG